METSKILLEGNIELPLNSLTRELHIPEQFVEESVETAVYQQVYLNLLRINSQLVDLILLNHCGCQQFNPEECQLSSLINCSQSNEFEQNCSSQICEQQFHHNSTKAEEETESEKYPENTTIQSSNKLIDLNSDQLNSNNSKKNMSQCDLYIKEVRFKSKSTRRKRVIYKCTYEGCSKKCQKRWNLIDHIKVHLGITPYQCDICDTKFVQKGNLKKHLRMHNVPDLNERKKYKCTVCNKAYTERYNLTNHMVSEHKTSKLKANSPSKLDTASSENSIF